jgi:PIN domain nuclease of toxin-antitoxin system
MPRSTTSLAIADALLLDTHAFLWWVADDDRLPARGRQAITSADRVFVSVASCWEIAIKASLGKLTLSQPVATFLAEQLGANEFTLLPIEMAHAAAVATLAFHHRDPFDRLLAGQALHESLPIVSADPVFRKYKLRRIW